MDFEARYHMGRMMFIPRVYYSHSDYDQTHPIFNTTREEDGLEASVIAMYFAPFGYKEWARQGLLSYSNGNSNYIKSPSLSGP